jgi:hypothetical protein
VIFNSSMIKHQLQKNSRNQFFKIKDYQYKFICSINSQSCLIEYYDLKSLFINLFLNDGLFSFKSMLTSFIFILYSKYFDFRKRRFTQFNSCSPSRRMRLSFISEINKKYYFIFKIFHILLSNL